MHQDQVVWHDDVTLRALGTLKWSRHEPHVLPMDVGEMDCAPHPAIRRLLSEQGDASSLGYAPAVRRSPMTAAVADFLQRNTGWTVSPSRIFPSGGAIFTLSECIRLFAPRGPCITFGPIYPGIRDAIQAQGRTILDVDSWFVLGFERGLEDVRRHLLDGCRTIVASFPHNPTGRALRAEEAGALVQLMEEFKVVGFFDEALLPLQFDRAGKSMGELAEGVARTFSFGTITKAWNVASLRASWVVTPTGADRARLEQQFRYRLSPLGKLSCDVAMAALSSTDHWLKNLNNDLSERARIFSEAVASEVPQVRTAIPSAGFSAWLDLSTFGLRPSPHVSILRHNGLALESGALYGQKWTGHVRANIASAEPVLREGARRLVEALSAAARR